jgi:hypothetical protein
VFNARRHSLEPRMNGGRLNLDATNAGSDG